MANRKFSQFTAGGASQVPTDVLVGLDLSQASALQNTKWTLNNLFAKPTLNITDGAMRFGAPGSAPAVSAAGEGSIYFDGTQFQVSGNAGAYTPLGDVSGSFTSGQVAYANGAKSLTSSSGFTFAANALTLGTSGTPGGLRLVGATGNYWNLASSSPAGNRTFYFPDSITPTTGNFLFVGTFGATVVTDWSTGLTWSNTTKQLTVTASLNDVIGLGVQNTSAGTAAQCQVGFTANGGAISLLSLTGTGFTTSGLYKANQLYWRGTTGITEMLFALDDASTAFKFGVNNVVAASINATSTEGLVLGIASTLTGRVKLYNSAGATYTQISAGNAAANLNYILPATSPTAGQFLQAGAPSGGNVTLTWATGGGGAPTNASYLVLSLNGTLTDERVFTLADTTLTEVDGGAGGNYTLGVNQANAFTWTAAHDWQTGTSQSNAIRLLKASIGATGQRDSDRFLWQAKANDGSEHTIEARGYINVVGNDGVGSLWTLDGRLDGGFNTLMTVNISSGVVTAIGGLVAGVASTTTGSLLMYHASGATSTTISAGNAASSLNYIWPATDPSSGQVLTASAPSGGNVTLTWATPGGGGTPGGSSTQFQYNNAGSFGGTARMTYTASPSSNNPFVAITSNADDKIALRVTGHTAPSSVNPFEVGYDDGAGARHTIFNVRKGGGKIAVGYLEIGGDPADADDQSQVFISGSVAAGAVLKIAGSAAVSPDTENSYRFHTIAGGIGVLDPSFNELFRIMGGGLRRVQVSRNLRVGQDSGGDPTGSGLVLAQTGVLELANASSAYLTKISAGNRTGADLTYTLPAGNPTTGYVMTGTTPSGDASTLSWDSVWNLMQTKDSNTAITHAGYYVSNSFTTGYESRTYSSSTSGSTAGFLLRGTATSGTTNILEVSTAASSNNLPLVVKARDTNALTVNATGKVALNGAATSSTYALTLRSTENAADGVLIYTTDGSGLGSGTGSLLLNPAAASGLGQFTVNNDGGFLFESVSANGGTYRGLLKFTTTEVAVQGARVRIGDTSTGAGNLLIGSTAGSIGTSGVGVLAIRNATAPTSSPSDEFQIYSADINGTAGSAGAHLRNEINTAALILPGVRYKMDTGDPTDVFEGMMVINTFDNTFKVYAEGAWRTLATW